MEVRKYINQKSKTSFLLLSHFCRFGLRQIAHPAVDIIEENRKSEDPGNPRCRKTRRDDHRK